MDKSLQLLEQTDKRYPVIGGRSDGREILDRVPNTESISASLVNYEELQHIRDVPISDFTLSGKSYSVSENERIRKLAEAIKLSNKISPLIIVVDQDGPYILEGGHRAESLFLIGAKSFPAVVVVDMEDNMEVTASDFHIVITGQASSDETYLQAVKDGDIETCQRMVDEAAKAAGYNIEGWHGTNQDGITVFYGGWWSENKKVTREFGSNRYHAYLKINNPIEDDAGYSGDKSPLLLEYNKFSGVERSRDEIEDDIFVSLKDEAVSGGAFTKHLIESGYDGSSVWDDSNGGGDAMAYVPFNPSQIKSAEPITRDDQGKVIPLSKRFDSSSSDIRFKEEAPIITTANIDILTKSASAAGLVDSPAFKSWFGNSKVVDENGKPLVVYHGTQNDIATFNMPAYFSESEDEAGAYANPRNFKEIENHRKKYSKGSGKKYAGQRFPSIGIFGDVPRSKRESVVATDQGVGIVHSNGRITIFDDVVIEEGSFDLESDTVRIIEGATNAYETAVAGIEDFIKTRYKTSTGEGGSVYPVYLSIQNPKEMSMMQGNRFSKRLKMGETEYQILEKLKAEGYDGIVTESDAAFFSQFAGEFGGETKNYIPFYSYQIKSAIGNRGDFDQGNTDITANSFNIIIKTASVQDEEYMKAVEANDMESCQRMVDETARKAGYRIVYHGTNSPDIRTFRPREGRFGKAIYTATSEERAKGYGSKVMRLFASPSASVYGPDEDAIVYSGDPNNFKSADAVTRDDTGRVVPLSERFNPKSNDIRFRASDSAVTQAQDAAYLAAVERGDMVEEQRMVDEVELRRLQPEWAHVPSAEMSNSRFRTAEQIDEPTLERIASQYERMADRAGIEPTDLRFHVGQGNAVVWSPYQSNDYVVGQFIGDVFAISHFAPDTQRSGLLALQDLLHSGTPVVFAVPDKLASQLSRIGFKESRVIVPMMFRGEVQRKHVLVNHAFNEQHLRDLISWYSIEMRNRGLTSAVAEEAKMLSPAAVTRDDHGNVIPLSKRFDSSSSDIRFKEDISVIKKAMATPSEQILSMPLYHATNNSKAGEEILADGFIRSKDHDTNNFLTPVKGMIYSSSSLENATIYALGGVMMGNDFRQLTSDSGRYGYIFMLDSKSMTDVQPDEDSVGEIFANGLSFENDGGLRGAVWENNGKAPVWLTRLGLGSVAWSRIKKAVDGEYIYYASIGKQLLPKMTDQQKLDLIENYGAHVAHKGAIKIVKAWKLDKSHSKEINRDGSNVLDIAEEVPLPNEPLVANNFNIIVKTASAPDEEYMKAVEAKDLKSCQRMVDEAARQSGYNIKAYHGTRAEEAFTSFRDYDVDKRSQAPSGTYFFTQDRDIAFSYAGHSDKIMSVVLKMDNPFYFDFLGADWQGDLYGKFEADNDGKIQYFDTYDLAYNWLSENRIDDPDQFIRKDPWVGHSTNSVVEKAKREGSDGAIMMNVIDNGSYSDPSSGTIYAVFDPSQIKSANPISYDDSGEIIPLSKRFNSGSSDIRFEEDAPIITTAGFEVITKTASSDEEYIKAAESGDIDVCQKMVDQAAKEAGYDIDAWHGTDYKNITSFKAGNGGRFGKGIYFADSPEMAKQFGEFVYHVFLSRGVSKLPAHQYLAVMPSQIKSSDAIIIDDFGNVIPLSQRFDSSSSDIRFEEDAPIITTASFDVIVKTASSDEAYLRAVEDGDMDTCQRMVDEAAKQAGSVTTKVHHVGGFDKSKHNTFNPGSYHGMIFFSELRSDAEERASDYGSEGGNLITEAYLFGNIFDVDNPNHVSEISKYASENGLDIEELESGYYPAWEDSDVIPYVKSIGFEGITTYEGDGKNWAVFLPSQIKSADPVTYDPSGNVIPLSKRFNSGSSDIRFEEDAPIITTASQFDVIVKEAIKSNQIGQNPNSYEGNAPIFDWNARDNQGVRTKQSVAKNLGVPPDKFIYQAMVDLNELTGIRVEKEEAKDLRNGNGEIEQIYVQRAIDMLDKWGSLETHFTNDEFEEWRDSLPWSWGEGYDEDDVKTLASEMQAREVEDSYPEEDFSMTFKEKFPPIEITRKIDGTIVVNDGNHRVDIWSKQGFDVAPAWVNDELLREKSKRYSEKSSSFDVVIKTSQEEDYRGNHQAPDHTNGHPLHDLSGIYPDDIYGANGARYYGQGDPLDSLGVAIMRAYRGRPNAQLQVYRAVPNFKKMDETIEDLEAQKRYIQKYGKIPPGAEPHGKNRSEHYDWLYDEIERRKLLPPVEKTKLSINVGDWVTTVKEYAKEHGESTLLGKYKVLSKTVYARDLFTTGDSVFEFGYDPQPAVPRNRKQASFDVVIKTALDQDDTKDEDPIEFFRDKTIRTLRETGFSNNILSNGGVLMYHGTSERNAKLILRQGKFNGYPFFSPDRQVAEQFSHQAGGKPVVIDLMVDPSAILPTGGSNSKYFSARMSGLQLLTNNIWGYEKNLKQANSFEMFVKTSGVSLTGYRSSASSPKGYYGTFYSLEKQSRPTVTKTISFDNLLEISHDEVIPFEGLPSEYLASKWFASFDFKKAASNRDMDDGEIMDEMVALEAVRRGYDGIRYGNLEFVDLHNFSPKQDMVKSASSKLSSEFDSWFAGSKVVDSNGNPLVMHHGTDKKFTVFDKSKTAQEIFWFTSDKDSIARGEAGASGSGNIMDAYLSIKNPAGWDAYEKLSVGQLFAQGYDGAILPEDGQITCFVFEPEQIKLVSVVEQGEEPILSKSEFNMLMTKTASSLDEEYMKAAESGDITTCQRLVNEAGHGITNFNYNGINFVGNAEITLKRWGESKEVYITGFKSYQTGDGLFLMRQLVKWADYHGFRLIGEMRPMRAEPEVVELDSNRLSKLYSIFGFEKYGTDNIARNPVERIISSAIKLQNGLVIYGKKYDNLWSGDVTFKKTLKDEYSHGGIIAENRGNLSDEQISSMTPGFITSLGRFVDRKEGAKIASVNGTVDSSVNSLHSEDFWNLPPIVRDEHGRILPISERFNSNNNKKNLPSEKNQKKYPMYLYHGTSYGALMHIKKEGLLPKDNGQVFLADNETYANSYALRKGNGVILRVINRGYQPDPRIAEPGDFVSSSKIDTKDIEVKLSDGNWAPLDSVEVDFGEINPIASTFEAIIKTADFSPEFSKIIAYHGTGMEISEFSYDFVGSGNDQLGSGFYFTTDLQQAKGYAFMPDAGPNPSVITAILNIKNPLDADRVGTIPRWKIKKLIELSPELDNALVNWGDVEYEGKNVVLNTAVDAYSAGASGVNIVRSLFPIANDFYMGKEKEFNDMVTKVLGYDGVVKNFGESKHYLVFRPEQIEIIKKEVIQKLASSFEIATLAQTDPKNTDFDISVQQHPSSNVSDTTDPVDPIEPESNSSIQLQDYVGDHSAPDHETGAPLHDLTLNGIYPNDFYENPSIYGSGGHDSGLWIAVGYHNHPNHSITVYRAMPIGVPRKINIGDWVSIERRYAVEHGRDNLNNKYQIVQKTVHARDIFTEGNSLDEWGYDPQPKDMEAIRKKRELIREKHKSQVYIEGRGWFDKDHPGGFPEPITLEERIKKRMLNIGYSFVDGKYVKIHGKSNYSNMVKISDTQSSEEFDIDKSMEDKRYDTMEKFVNHYDDAIDDAIIEFAHSFLAHKEDKKWIVPWDLVSAPRLVKIWNDNAKMGFVRDEKGMDDIAEKMIRNVARFKATNAISGHDTFDPRDELADLYDIVFTDEQWDQFEKGMEDKDGQWMVSDYGLPKLEALVFKLGMANSAEEQLLLVDQMLNVIHPRGDLAAQFIEGGSKTLNDLFLNGTIANSKTIFTKFNEKLNFDIVVEDELPKD
jgi:hypothetical protein